MALIFKRQTNYYRQIRRRKRSLRLSMVLLFLAVVGIVVVAIILWNRHGENSPAVSSQHAKTVTFDPYQTFQSPFFTFQADKSWKAIPAESAPDSFVYRGFRNNLVERDLTVYINTLPPRLMLTYVLPVQSSQNRLHVDDISEHCRNYASADYLKSSRNPTTLSFKNVSFLCQVDGTSVTIGTGQQGGSYQVSLSRQNGSTARYFLLYHDLSFTPKPQLFKAIAESFQAR